MTARDVGLAVLVAVIWGVFGLRRLGGMALVLVARVIIVLPRRGASGRAARVSAGRGAEGAGAAG
jgi:hypothetical protein